jgi:hypothetical protein
MAVSDLFVKNNFTLQCNIIDIADSATINGKDVAVINYTTNPVALTVTSSPAAGVDVSINVKQKRIGIEDAPTVAYMYIPSFVVASGQVTEALNFLEINMTAQLSYLPEPGVFNTSTCVVSQNGTGTAGLIVAGVDTTDPDNYHYYVRIYKGAASVSATDGAVSGSTDFTSGEACGLASPVILTYFQQFQ